MSIDTWIATPPRGHWTEEATDADMRAPCKHCPHTYAEHDPEKGRCLHPACVRIEEIEDALHEFEPVTHREDI